MKNNLVTIKDISLGAYVVGIYQITLPDRRIISLPSQIGCPVACDFCISKNTKLIRNITSSEIIFIINKFLESNPPDGRPIEISFTGEGEPVLNWKELGDACRKITTITNDISLIRYCFSGIGCNKLLGKISSGELPMRLQFSLHAARQSVRDNLICKSQPLDLIQESLIKFEKRFQMIKMNVVLIDGINDSEEDLIALKRFGKDSWPILLNPQLSESGTRIARQVDYFYNSLINSGRIAFKYSKVGISIDENSVYQKLTARKIHENNIYGNP